MRSPKKIGSHCYPKISRMDVHQQRLWKLIWWSMYTRDRLIALSMRRPRHIGNDDYDVAPLVLQDFEPIALLQEVFE